MEQIVTEIKTPRKLSEKEKEWRLRNRDRLREQCKSWNRQNRDRLKLYRLENRDKLIETSKGWQKSNKDKARVHHNNWVDKNRDRVYEINRKWRESNRDVYLKRRNENEKTRRNEDPLYKLSQNIRYLISCSFRRGKVNFRKAKKTEEILGCSIDFFIDYILSLCPEDVTCKDFGRYGYHIDHKIPVSSAKTVDDIITLNHYTNLQPLFHTDNLRKSNKITI